MSNTPHKKSYTVGEIKRNAEIFLAKGNRSIGQKWFLMEFIDNLSSQETTEEEKEFEEKYSYVKNLCNCEAHNGHTHYKGSECRIPSTKDLKPIKEINEFGTTRFRDDARVKINELITSYNALLEVVKEKK